MYRHILIVSAFLLSNSAPAVETIATTPEYNAVAFFTSGIFNDVPIDRIDTAYINQERIILYVEWSNLQQLRYETKVRVLGPTGILIREIRHAFQTGRKTHNSWYWYEPTDQDPVGEWTFELYVNGENSFYALIPVGASQ